MKIILLSSQLASTVFEPEKHAGNTLALGSGTDLTHYGSRTDRTISLFTRR